MKLWVLRVILFLAISGAAACGSGAGDHKNDGRLEIRWGIDPTSPPQELKLADGTLSGISVGIGDAICRKLDARCSWVESDWDGIIPGLLANKFDAIISGMSITEERSRVVDFSVKYVHTPELFVGPEGAYPDNSPEALAGKKIGIQSGTTHHDYMLAKYAKSVIKPYPTAEEAWLDLAIGRIDIVFTGALVADQFLKTSNGEGFGVSGKPIIDATFFGEGAGIAVRKGDDERREKINQAIAELLESGEYYEITKRYTDFDVYSESLERL